MNEVTVEDPRKSAIRFLAAVTLLSAAVPGCGGGGGDGSGGIVPSACVEFEAAAGAAPSTAVTRQGSGSGCDIVVVDVVLTDVADVAAASFDVTFDASLFRYDGYSLGGSHLSSDGATIEVLEDARGGRVSLGLARLNPAPGIDFDDSRILVRLLFGKASGDVTGPGPLAFPEARVFGSEEPPVEKTGIRWFGGTLRVE